MKFLNDLVMLGVAVYCIGNTSCAKHEETHKIVTQQKLLDVLSKSDNANYKNDTSKNHILGFDSNSKLYKK